MKRLYNFNQFFYKKKLSYGKLQLKYYKKIKIKIKTANQPSPTTSTLSFEETLNLPNSFFHFSISHFSILDLSLISPEQSLRTPFPDCFPNSPALVFNPSQISSGGPRSLCLPTPAASLTSIIPRISGRQQLSPTNPHRGGFFPSRAPIPAGNSLSKAPKFYHKFLCCWKSYENFHQTCSKNILLFCCFSFKFNSITFPCLTTHGNDGFS